ncbi:MAG TPA: MarR family transcriptional regulator [Gemmatimonadaceae bacterium]|nr:MarR family transcriptional regulator [Gemmatimonadaceae bacterium]
MAQKPLDTAVTDLGSAIGQLVRRMRAASAAQELSLTEAAVMARLAKDGPATTADLARAEGVRPQSMGTTVAALEEMGMVERTPHPTDGRQLLIALTPAGAAARKTIGDAKRTWLAHAVARLDERDRTALFAAGRIMARMVERDQA